MYNLNWFNIYITHTGWIHLHIYGIMINHSVSDPVSDMRFRSSSSLLKSLNMSENVYDCHSSVFLWLQSVYNNNKYAVHWSTQGYRGVSAK